MRLMRAETCQLYLITPPTFGTGGAEAFANTLAATLDAERGSLRATSA